MADMEDITSTSKLESSNTIATMSNKIREQSELIESLTRDLKQNLFEKNQMRDKMENRINELISQRNIFTNHMSEMETIWNEKLQTISSERDKLQYQLRSMINELKQLSDNPAVITARKHAKEMEEKLNNNEKDMNLLIESIKQEKSTLIDRIHDQAISIHNLTENDKDYDKKWLSMALDNTPTPIKQSNIENKSYNESPSIMKSYNTPEKLSFNSNTPLSKSSINRSKSKLDDLPDFLK